MSRLLSVLTLLLVCAVSVAAIADCTPTSTKQGEVSTNNCGLFSNSLTKSEGYLIKYPNDAAATSVNVEGKGNCGGGQECWPEFHPEEVGDGYWRKRVVDKQAIFASGQGTWSCGVWQDRTVVFDPDPYTSCPRTCEAGGGYDMENGCTPVIVDTSGNGFQLTHVTDGINFDFDGDGQSVRTAWTAASSDDAWLVLDRNGNGQIDNGSELFGNFSPQPPASDPNGYMALAEYDKFTNGGNIDGRIDSSDAIYNSLRLWRDANHNGVSESTELFTLQNLGLASIDLDYRESKKRDQYGNLFFYRSKVSTNASPNFSRWCYDVILRNGQ